MLTPKNVVLTVIAANMVCRPAITMSNRELPEDTRRYTAIREFSTELFGLFNTMTLASAIELLGPRLLDRKLTRQAINRLKDMDWSKLSVADQKLKAAVLISSLVGTILSLGFATPILNNLVLNRLLDKITGKKPDAAGQTATPAPGPALRPAQNPVFQTLASGVRPVTSAKLTQR